MCVYSFVCISEREEEREREKKRERVSRLYIRYLNDVCVCPCVCLYACLCAFDFTCNGKLRQIVECMDESALLSKAKALVNHFMLRTACCEFV